MTDKLGDSLLEGDVGEVTMTVDNINYFVKDKHVLKGVTAQFVPNEIVALMGELKVCVSFCWSLNI